LVEKPAPADAPSRWAIPGRYILTPDIFPILANAKPGLSGEIQLTDSLQTLADSRELYAYKFVGQRFDAGDKLGFIQANIHYALKRPELRPQLLRYMKQLINEHGKELE
jgi:UTP--glucose-1-phosphate uridylyltransferase